MRAVLRQSPGDWCCMLLVWCCCCCCCCAEDVWRTMAVSIPRVRDGPRLGSTDPSTHLVAGCCGRNDVGAGDEWRHRSTSLTSVDDVTPCYWRHVTIGRTHSCINASLQLASRHQSNAMLLIFIFIHHWVMVAIRTIRTWLNTAKKLNAALQHSNGILGSPFEQSAYGQLTPKQCLIIIYNFHIRSTK